MRSVFIFLKEIKSDKLISFLNSICKRVEEESWFCEIDNDPALYIEFYEEKYWCCDYEPNEWEELVNKIGY